ncbi:MAG: hypothetical protein KQI35_08985 [Bacteroidetes bacterium]|nr:hypothetical protein [Bacteroidota bacterium]
MEVLSRPELKSCEVYDPTTDTWTELTPMPSVQATHAACVLEGRIYVFGGCNSAPPTYESYKKGAEVGIPEWN